MSSLRDAAAAAIDQCLDLSSDETLVIVTDDKREPIGKALYDAAKDVTVDATILQCPPGSQHGAEPPEPIAAAMKSADAYLAPTTKSLSHTRAREHATESGARGATLPGITEEVFLTGLSADYDEIRQNCETVYEQVVQAEQIRVTSPQGTDFTVTPGTREWFQDTGIIRDDGAFSNLPAGEVFVAPATANGTYVVDGTMMPYGRLEADSRLEFHVDDGQVTEISDEAVREQIETAAEDAGEAAYNLAELGIGTNVGVTDLVGSVLLDEKAAGTVHIAIGDNAAIGGETEAPLHLDGILRDPTVYADGEELELPGV
jgi:Leucyl aminopeptidase (aminopeptidase T)